MNTKDMGNETIAKIVEKSIELFSQHGYEGTSISDISKKTQMSRGILYHYFKSKEELYLYCAKLCIETHRTYLNDHLNDQLTGKEAVLDLLRFKLQFFEQYPEFRMLFYHVITQKPIHLANELCEIRKTLKEENRQVLMTALTGVKLGHGVTIEDALNFIILLQNSSAYAVETLCDSENIKAHKEATLRTATIFISGLENDFSE